MFKQLLHILRGRFDFKFTVFFFFCRFEQIFFRASVLHALESQRDEKLSGVFTQLQARCRGYLARKDFAKLKVNDIAVRCIQRNVKKFMVVRDWPWWRLLVRITPLLNVHRTEIEIKQKSVSKGRASRRRDRRIFFKKKKTTPFLLFQDELEQLRSRVDKLEQERSQLKMDNDRLEQRVSVYCVDANSVDSSRAARRSFFALERIRRSAIGQWPKSFNFHYPGPIYFYATDILRRLRVI